jgi:hypothetical protein
VRKALGGDRFPESCRISNGFHQECNRKRRQAENRRGSILESALIQFSKSAQSPATENYLETSGMVRIAGLEPAN